MSFWVAILLGFVQGITEFLPISSSGHLVILENILNVETNEVLLNVLLHVATLFAVCIFYRKKLKFCITNPFSKLNFCLVLATLPAILFVLLFGKMFETFFNSTFFVGVGFLVTAIFLSFAQIIASKNKVGQKLNWKNSSIMGIAQAFAVFPGLSRSGTTFSFGVVFGMDKDEALDFSFLMSIPIIVASLCYELFFHKITFNIDIVSASVSFLIAFLTAIFGLKIMKKIVQKINLWWFIVYLFLAGLLTIIFL